MGKNLTKDPLENVLSKLRTILGFTLWGLTTVWIILYFKNKSKGKETEF